VDSTIAKTWEARTYLIGIAIFSIVLMIPVALFLSHLFVKPIYGLIGGAQAFGKGNLAYRIPEKSSDEVGELATAFNSMAGSMQRAQGELEHLNQRLEEYNRDLEQKIHEATEALVEKNREMQDDLNIAAEFQTAILSAIPTTSFLQCAMKYIPYGGGVSGDVYDMSIDRDGAANIFLGDATGHGVAAAIMTMMAQIGLDSLREDLSTDEIIRQLNSLFATRERDMSITGVFMRIAPSGKLLVSNAGHPPVIIVPVDSHTPVHLKEGGTPLGMFKEEIAPFVELEYNLKPGDKVFLYTDGITEWLNPEEDEFGIERLTEFLMQNGDTQIDVTLNNLLIYVNKFAKNRSCEDDLTLMGFQYQPM
jgi:sigma-B regulation protein RsbU (phosphoserine phosphatase)